MRNNLRRVRDDAWVGAPGSPKSNDGAIDLIGSLDTVAIAPPRRPIRGELCDIPSPPEDVAPPRLRNRLSRRTSFKVGKSQTLSSGTTPDYRAGFRKRQDSFSDTGAMGESCEPPKDWNVQDPFVRALMAVKREHDVQCNQWSNSNEELKAEMQKYLAATFKVGGGGALVKAPHHIKSVCLSLSPTNGNNKGMKWTIPRDELVDKRDTARFTCKPTWKSVEELFESGEHTATRNIRRSASFSAKISTTSHKIDDEEVRYLRGFGSSCILSPSGNVRLAWILATAVMLFYDICSIPLSFFSINGSAFTDVMDYVTLIFWTLDMVMSLLSGYFDKGVMVMAPSQILKNYCTSWFWLDVIVVGPDWIFTILGDVIRGSGGASNVTGLVRVMRIVRVVRLLRLAKLRRIITKAKDLIASEVMFLIISIVQWLVIILFMNHIIAGLWFLVGDTTRDSGEASWTSDYESHSATYKYFICLQWAISQVTLAETPLVPRNTLETVFQIFVSILNGIVFAGFASHLTLCLMQLQKINGEHEKQLWIFRRYCRQEGVPASLQGRILHYLEYKRRSQKERIPLSQIDLLGDLTSSLTCEFMFITTCAGILSLPLFQFVGKFSKDFMFSLVAKNVLEFKSYAVDEILFRQGSIATHLIVIVDGKMSYESNDTELEVEKDDWVCEMALWVSWVTRGFLEVLDDAVTEAVLLNVNEFGELVQTDESLMSLMCAYQESFVAWMNEKAMNDSFNDVLSSQFAATSHGFVRQAQQLLKKNGETVLSHFEYLEKLK